MIGADGQHRDLRPEPIADLVKALEVSGVAGVINGVLARAKHVSAESTVHIANNARAPMVSRSSCDLHAAHARGFPPLQFDHTFEAEIKDQVTDILRADDDGTLAAESA